ncbi:MAG: PLP-dependent transferase, partial [Oceanibaculum sp.]
GDRVVSSRVLFGSCHWIISTLLPRYGIETVLVDGGDLEAWRDALKPGAQAVFFETPSNPILGLVDIAAVSELAHAAG